jgi:acyl-CoA dehydrogenase
MEIQLDDVARNWQEKAYQFAREELIPHEVEAELNDGELPEDVLKHHHKRAVELGFSSMDVPLEYGGLALRNVDQVAVWEQLGRVTNALCWCFSEPHQWMFEACDEDQLRQYILPLMDGSRKECYAITEGESGSDVRIDSTATACKGGYHINGEKWYVTSANHADYLFIQAKLTEGPHAGHDAMFLLDKETSGIGEVRTPVFSHTFNHHHPTLRFKQAFVPLENRLGQEGGGMAFSHSWFRRERLMIAARCCGAMARMIEEVSEFAQMRMVGGEPLIEKQLVQAMLADSVTDLWTSRLVTFETADAHDRGENVKSLHARCAMAKLLASEAAGRVADRTLQIFGGRGYMRENCAERFTRELRVDRIWEGASEVQRLTIARALIKRGLNGI